MDNQPATISQNELDAIKARLNRKMLNITEYSIDGMEALLHSMDDIDNAIAQKVNLDDASVRELIDLSKQRNESFRVRLDFMKALSGHNVDTSNVDVEKPAEKIDTTTISEDDAGRIKAEILKRLSLCGSQQTGKFLKSWEYQTT